MSEFGINPMAIGEGPDGGYTYGSATTPPEQSGGGLALGLPASGEDGYARKPGMRRRMMPMPGRPGVMGDGGQVDPQVVQMVMGHFLQMLQQGGQSGAGGALPMRAFANGGIVNRPTIGLLGERGPEAVIPLGGGQAGQPQGSWPRPTQQATGYRTDLSRYYQPQQPQGPNPQAGYGMSPWLFGAARDAGIYGPNPPQAIMEGVRNRIIQDNAAQARSARLGLMGRTDIDPSTFGFQSLMSDLQGQQNLQRGLSDADLRLRQQQAEFLQRLFLNEHGQGWNQVHAREQAAREGTDWGGILSGVGTLAGAAFGVPVGAAAGGAIGGMVGGGSGTTGMGGGGYYRPPQYPSGY